MKQENNTEQQILAAAEMEFMSKGFAGARTTSIAEAAGVTHAMLHYYFRTKEQLFNKVLDKKISEVLNSVAIALQQTDGQGIVDRICNATRAHFEFLSARPELPLFVINEVITRPERLAIYSSLVPGKVIPALQNAINDVERAVHNEEISQINPLNLLIDIAALNVITIFVKPLILSVTGMSGDYYDAMRIEENICTIKKRLRP